MSESPKIAFKGRFHDANLKFQHAQKHLSALTILHNELGDFWKVKKVGEEALNTVRVSILREPTVEWSLIIGDLVHGLRGCLDYATCGLVEAEDPKAPLKRVQFPFGKLGTPLRPEDVKDLKALGPATIAAIEEVRKSYGDDLDLLRAMSNRDKHRLLLPVAVRQLPKVIVVDEASNTASIEDDLPGGLNVLAGEIKDGEFLPMPNILSLAVGLLIEELPSPFILRNIERVNASVWDTFWSLAMIQIPLAN